MSLLAPFFLWEGGSTNPLFDMWFAIGATVFFGVVACGEAVFWYRDYKREDASLGLWARLAAATTKAAEELDEYSEQHRSESPRTLMDHNEGVRRGMAVVYLLALSVLFLTAPAQGWGYFRAGQTTFFLVSADYARLVALRRFGSTLVVAEIDEREIRAFRFLDATDPTRRWVRQHVGPLTGLPQDIERTAPDS